MTVKPVILFLSKPNPKRTRLKSFKREKLYEEEEDLKNIRAVTEISKEQYEEVMKLMELMKE